MNRRALGAAFVLTVAAAVGVSLQDQAPANALVPAVVPATRASAATSAATSAADRVAPPAAEPAAPTGRAPLPEPPPAAVAAWRGAAPAATPAPAAASAVRPAPPPFPYRWIGRLDDTLLLAGRERSFGAVRGDVIDQRWRIERIADARLQVTWLPTGEPVFVEFR